MESGSRILLALAVFGTVALASGCGGDDKSESKDTQTIVSEATPGVAKILGKHDDFNSESNGFVYDAGPPVRVVTDASDLDGQVAVKVKLGNEGSFGPAKLVGVSPCDDVAVLEPSESPSEVSALPLGDSSTVENGAPLVQLSFEGDPEASTTQDLASATVTAVEGSVQNPSVADVEYSTERAVFPALLQHSVEPGFGINGAPLLDVAGEVVGMALYSTDGDGRYALPIDAVKEALPSLEAGLGSGYLGLNLGPLSDVSEDFRVNDYTERYGFSKARAQKDVRFDERNLEGLYVKSEVSLGSPAEGEVFAGDLIEEIDGQKVPTVGALCEIIQKKEPGATIEATGVSLTSLENYTPNYDKARFEATITLLSGASTGTSD